jgi:hypothetical protein
MRESPKTKKDAIRSGHKSVSRKCASLQRIKASLMSVINKRIIAESLIHGQDKYRDVGL